MSVHRYEGKDIVIHYDAKRCIHAAECVRGLPTVFDPQAKPWVQPDNASAEELAEVVRRCPTGALTATRPDGSAVEEVTDNTVALIEADGPLYLRGRVVYSGGSHAALVEHTRVALCRCGASRNKPFCDGSHRKSDFRDEGLLAARPQDLPRTDPPAPAGAVKLNPVANGPLMVEGWVEFKAADGSTLVTGDKCWLCRCGLSKNKPLCDGSHKTASSVT